VPHSNRAKYKFEREILGRNTVSNSIQNIYIQDKINRIIVINNYEKNTQTCSNTSIDVFAKDTLTEITSKVDIVSMKWDYDKKDWHINTAYIREFAGPDKESLQIKNDVNLSTLKGLDNINLSPDILEKKQLKPEELVLSEFKEFIDNLEASGQDVSRQKVDYYSIISFPFANIITIIFGVSVSSNRRKGGAALHFGISLIVSFIYLGFVKISQVFGYNGDLNPVFTAWLANIVFLTVSLVNFYRLNN
jgi:lipopolysaccharide export system permease protein